MVAGHRAGGMEKRVESKAQRVNSEGWGDRCKVQVSGLSIKVGGGDRPFSLLLYTVYSSQQTLWPMHYALCQDRRQHDTHR